MNLVIIIAGACVLAIVGLVAWIVKSASNQ